MHIEGGKVKVLSLLAVGMTILAAPITGTLNFTGNAQISNDTINFQCDLLGVCNGSNGDFFLTGGSANTGTFQTISILNRFGQVVDIVSPPLNVAILIPEFATFTATNDVVLDITKVFMGVGGSCPPSAGQVCTPVGSPLNISMTQTGAVATFSVLANARRISTGEITPYRGLFTLQFTQNPLSVISQLPGGTVDTSYSASFSPGSQIVPEPSSTIL